MAELPFKDFLEDYTEEEFLRFVRIFFEHGIGGNTAAERRQFKEQMVEHFERITQHERGCGVIFFPEEGQEDSPEGIVAEVKRWRAEQGLPGFKQ